MFVYNISELSSLYHNFLFYTQQPLSEAMTTATITRPQEKLAKDNPFYGMGHTLDLLIKVSKMTENPSKPVIHQYLNNAWTECKDNLEKRKLFFCVVLSLGDITNREHNIFRKLGITNVDNGGNSLRKVFLYALEWMHTNCVNEFYRLLPIFGEYYNLGAATVFHTIWTNRFTGAVEEVFRIPINIERLTDYIASVLKNPRLSENEAGLWARWLWNVPTSSRKRTFVVTEQGLKYVRKTYKADAQVGDTITRLASKQDETKRKDAVVLECIRMLSKKMGWEVVKKKNNLQYVGYQAFRKRYMAETEATLFSSKRILSFDKVQFINWLDQLPSGARYNVQRRILDKKDNKLVPNSKWINNNGDDLGTFYLEWMQAKEEAQKKVRQLAPEEREQLAKSDPKMLKQMLKDAKVNTGAETIMDVFVQFLAQGSTREELNIKAQSILDLVKLEVPTLVIADDSGSMPANVVTRNEVRFTPEHVCALIVTIFLLKNPAPELGDMFIRFNDSMDVIYEGAKAQVKDINRFLSRDKKEVPKLVDRSKDFITNIETVHGFLNGTNGTNFAVVADSLYNWVNEDGGAWVSSRKESINNYPVFLVVSDGDMNSRNYMNDPAAVMRDFLDKMRKYFGWNGIVVVWDVKNSADETSNFSGIENVIHLSGFNVGILDQVFKNIHDLDVIDVYTPLKSIYLSNRYTPVRDLVL